MFHSKTTSDSHLVLAVLKGRREDFGVLVRRYLPAVHAVRAPGQRLRRGRRCPGRVCAGLPTAGDTPGPAQVRTVAHDHRAQHGDAIAAVACPEIVAELPPPPSSVIPDVEQRELLPSAIAQGRPSASWRRSSTSRRTRGLERSRDKSRSKVIEYRRCILNSPSFSLWARHSDPRKG